MKIFLATPMYGGNAKSVYVASVSDLTQELTKRGHTVRHISITNESLITRARNTLAHEFVKSDYDALLFIDGDHGFVAEDVADMVESGKDLIGAVYPMKIINWDNVRAAALAGKPNLDHYSGAFAINFLPEDQTFKANEPFKVRDIGTGMMFISRNVFETLDKTLPKYKSNSLGISVNMGEEITEYFTTRITPEPESILLSEDYAFCEMWRQAGGDVYAAPWVRITHAGEYNFNGSFLAMLEIQNRTVTPEDAPEDSSQSSDTSDADSE
jgi:hypothetical protein